jgi:HAD superfamily hydrolase (TIGR01490 family)
MAIAFFDLDRTLLSVNAGELWMRAELREGHITRWQATKAAMYIAGYHFGFSGMEGAIHEAIATLAGKPESDIVERTERFYAREVHDVYRPRAREVVAAHRARGDVLALLSSSSMYLARPVGQELGLDHLLCNQFEVVDSRFTGKPQGGLCFGKGKVTHARALAERLNERLEDATFYTDSYSDLPVLEMVGRPVAVHPDPRLARTARARKWEIADWG